MAAEEVNSTEMGATKADTAINTPGPDADKLGKTLHSLSDTKYIQNTPGTPVISLTRLPDGKGGVKFEFQKSKECLTVSSHNVHDKSVLKSGDKPGVQSGKISGATSRESSVDPETPGNKPETKHTRSRSEQSSISKRISNAASHLWQIIAESSRDSNFTEEDYTEADSLALDKQSDLLVNRIYKKDSSSRVFRNKNTWANRSDFIMTSLAYSSGIGNIFRFPYVAYKYGGGTFFIAYVVLVVVLAIPVMFIEMSLGQFTRYGPLNCWKFARLFKGIGMAMVLNNILSSLFYSLILVWTLDYLLRDITGGAALFGCLEDDEVWKKAFCVKLQDICHKTFPKFNASQGHELRNASTHDHRAVHDDNIISLSSALPRYTNCTDASGTEYWVKYSLSTQVFFWEDVMASSTRGSTFEWWHFVGLFVLWAIVALSHLRGVNLAAKLSKICAILPNVCLVGLLCHGLALEGGLNPGLYNYVAVQTHQLAQPSVWIDAAHQVLLSFSIPDGGLIYLASQNKFDELFSRDMLFMVMGNLFGSFVTGAMVFAYEGNISVKLGVNFYETFKQGPSMVVVVMSSGMSQLPHIATRILSALFGIVVISLGLVVMFIMVQNCTSYVYEFKGRSRKHKPLVILSVTLVYLLVALAFCFKGRNTFYLWYLVWIFSDNWGEMFICISVCVAIAYVFGADDYLCGIDYMLSQSTERWRVPWCLWRRYLKVHWCFITPATLVFLIVADVVVIDGLDVRGSNVWVEITGWLMTASAPIAILSTMVVAVAKQRGPFLERLRLLTNPNKTWGPAHMSDRLGWVAHCQVAFEVALKTPRRISGIGRIAWAMIHGIDEKGSDHTKSEDSALWLVQGLMTPATMRSKSLEDLADYAQQSRRSRPTLAETLRYILGNGSSKSGDGVDDESHLNDGGDDPKVESTTV